MAGRKRKIGARDFGIDLTGAADGEIFKWLIACQLFGERIPQDAAATTFAALDSAGYTTAQTLAGAHWPDLVDVLNRGGYRTYDQSTARELISTGQVVLDTYGGSMGNLYRQADSRRAVAARAQQFEGIGPIAAAIFLLEMRGIWS